MNTETGYDLLRLVPDQAGNEFEWLGCDAKGAVCARGHADAAGLPAHKNLQLIVPANQLAAHQIVLPPGAGRHQQALIEQALEDTLIGTRADSHIVPAETTEHGRRVWVINRNWLKAKLGLLAGAGLKADAAYSEYDLLATGHYAVTASGLLFHAQNVGLLDDEEMLAQLCGESALQKVDDLHAHAPATRAISLLTGEFQPQHTARFDIKAFKRSGWFALAICGVLFLSALARWQQLESREKALKAEIRQTFASAFPGTPIVMDPYLQWESRRRESGAGETYVRDDLDLVANLANRLGADIRPKSIESRDGTITVLLTESDAAKIREKLQSLGREHQFRPAEAGYTRLEIRRADQP
jgi:type II secretion system protein L